MVVLNIYLSVINTKQMPLVGSYLRASGKSREKKSNFAEKTADFAGISWKFSRAVLLKNDWEGGE